MVVQKRTIIITTAALFFASFLFLTLSYKDSTQQINEKETVFTDANLDSNSQINSTHNHQHTQMANMAPNISPGGTKLKVIDRLPSIAPTEDIILDDNLWIPAGWSGLPLSFDNPLYLDPKVPEVVQHRNELVAILEKFSLDDWYYNEGWPSLLYGYENLIGWNGIFDAVKQAQEELDIDVPSRLHSLGEILANSTLITKNRYIVEITSRDILHKAPMHGGVWSIVNKLLDNFTASHNIAALFSTIDEELCFFKNEDNMGNIWISCVHGVGHGIGDYYGVNKIAVGLDICSQHPDQQYQYACATGIFMTLEPFFNIKTFAPCDSNRFAPACYRFKNRLFNQLFYDTADPCSTQPTPYHKRACIWGYSYIIHARPRDAYKICEPFKPVNETEEPAAGDYAACFDGFLGSHEILNLPEQVRQVFCDKLSPYERAHSICEYYMDTTLRRFTFEDEEVYFYNYELLEELFDPSVLGKSAVWLPEWNRIALQPAR